MGVDGISTRIWLVTALFVICGAVPVSTVAKAESKSAPASVEQEIFGLPYTFTIEGVTARDTQSDIRDISACHRLRDRPPITIGQAWRRLQRDYEPIAAFLQDQGYLGASVTGRIDAAVSPIELALVVVPGDLYKVTDLAVTWRGDKPKLSDPSKLARIGVNRPATAKTVAEVITELGQLLYRNGYPFAANAPPTLAVIDDDPVGARLSVEIEAGRRYRFGPVSIDGLKERQPRVITRRIPWLEGDTFDLLELSHLEKVLMQTGLFSVVRVEPVVKDVEDDATGADALLPVHVQLTERKARTARIGVSYETDEGFGGKLDWTHRDFFGGGETFSLSTRATELGYSGNVKVGLPSSRWRGINYSFQGLMGNDRYDAYHAQTFEVINGVDWSRYRGVILQGGLRWKHGDVTQLEVDRRYVAWSLPVTLMLDFTDSLLDPHGGVRFSTTSIPTVEDGGGETRFLKNMASVRTYWTPVQGKRPLTLAVRGSLGVITGADHEDVFADERYYAGGGGSVRGYEFQSIGPMVDGVPIGGRSVIEGSGELRAVFTERWGGALFLDGGMVYEAEVPDFSDDLLWSAGFGVRIFTPIGPARLDLAFPLTPRSDIDEAMMFYISLGQAF